MRPTTTAILDARAAGIEALNLKFGAEHGSRFFLFHRDRQWNAREQAWIGWERKRGKIEEFNRLLRGATDTSFSTQVGDLDVLPSVRYCITLDSDTRLPRDAAQAPDWHHRAPVEPAALRPAAGTRHRRLRHPAAARQRDDGERGGFALRAHVRRPHRRRSVHDGRVRRLPGSLRRRHLHGQRTLRRRCLYGGARRARAGERAALARSVRGPLRAHGAGRPTSRSWTTTPRACSPTRGGSTAGSAATGRSSGGCFPFVPSRTGIVRNRLPLIARWKILDNLRRSLVPPATLLLLVLGWTVLPGHPLAWTRRRPAAAGVPRPLARPRGPCAVHAAGQSWGVFLRDGGRRSEDRRGARSGCSSPSWRTRRASGCTRLRSPSSASSSRAGACWSGRRRPRAPPAAARCSCARSSAAWWRVRCWRSATLRPWSLVRPAALPVAAPDARAVGRRSVDRVCAQPPDADAGGRR